MNTKAFLLYIIILLISSTTVAQDILSNPEIMKHLSNDSTYSAYYKNGQLSHKYSFKNGGLWNIEEYAENGKPVFFGTIKDGNGSLENHISMDGGKSSVRQIGNYLNGKPAGKWQIYWDAKGQILYKEFLYENGQIVSEVYYDKKGRKETETIYNQKKEPINIKYYKQGKLTQETNIEYQKNKRPKYTKTDY